MFHPYDLILVGLTLDVAGGLMLAKGFMMKHLKDVVRESATRSGGNGAMMTSALLQRSEAWIGGVLLAGGFLLQLWGNLHGAPAANELGWISTLPRLAVLGGTVATLTYLAMSVGHWSALRERNRHFAGPEKWNV